MKKNSFDEIDIKTLKDNTFALMDDDWMLITAGNVKSFNTMTAAWGGFGILWHKPVVFAFIRPTRYTYEFMEKNKHFTLCYFEEKYREILKICGTKSGREYDKIKNTGLIPLENKWGSTYFEQSRMVIACKKIYYDDFKPGLFLDDSIHREYPKEDYHRFYIGKIEQCLIKREK